MNYAAAITQNAYYSSPYGGTTLLPPWVSRQSISGVRRVDLAANQWSGSNFTSAKPRINNGTRIHQAQGAVGSYSYSPDVSSIALRTTLPTPSPMARNLYAHSDSIPTHYYESHFSPPIQNSNSTQQRSALRDARTHTADLIRQYRRLGDLEALAVASRESRALAQGKHLPQRPPQFRSRALNECSNAPYYPQFDYRLDHRSTTGNDVVQRVAAASDVKLFCERMGPLRRSRSEIQGQNNFTKLELPIPSVRSPSMQSVVSPQNASRIWNAMPATPLSGLSRSSSLPMTSVSYDSPQNKVTLSRNPVLELPNRFKHISPFHESNLMYTARSPNSYYPPSPRVGGSNLFLRLASEQSLPSKNGRTYPISGPQAHYAVREESLRFTPQPPITCRRITPNTLPPCDLYLPSQPQISRSKVSFNLQTNSPGLYSSRMSSIPRINVTRPPDASDSFHLGGSNSSTYRSTSGLYPSS